MAHLAPNLLGSFVATRDGESVSAFATDKVRGLLAYVAVEAGLRSPCLLSTDFRDAGLP